jgi:hypothetical protein
MPSSYLQRKISSLSDDEWQLLVELLENERRELPAEIRRTDATDYKVKLAERLRVVDRLLDALQKRR